MKKIFFFLLIIECAQHAFGQIEKFDIATYTPPKDFKKENAQGAVTYTHIDTKTGSFCVIAIYTSSASTGNEQKDFTKEWNDHVIVPFQAAANPKTETQTSPEGWKAVAGAAAVKQDGLNAYAVLTVFSGFGKSMSVLADLNDQAYLSQVNLLLDNMQLDKASTPIGVTIGKTNPTINKDNSAREKFGHMLVPPLKGWNLTKYTNADIFIPNDLVAGQSFELRVLESKPFTGTLQQAMSDSWNDLLQQLKSGPAYNGAPFEIVTEKTSYKGWEYIRARGTTRPVGEELERWDTHLFVIKLNNRIERIAVIGLMNVNQGEYSPWVNQQYQQAIEEFFYNVKFDDWTEPSLANGTIRNEGIFGLYEGLKLSGGSLDGSYTLFFPNGQIFNGPKFPLNGFFGLNTWVEAELRKRYWGTYSIQNGKGLIKMGYGNIPIKVSGNDIIVTTQNTEHKYAKVPSVDGAVFNGTYGFTGDFGGKNPYVKFTLDGKFVDYGGLDILNHQTTDPYDITKEPGNGTYKVKDFTLVFNYSDGRTLQLVFTGEGYNRNNASPASLTIGFNNDIIYRK